jgi:hypothetical protein
MARPIWFVNLVEKYFPSRFSLAKLTKVPIVGRVIDCGLFEDDDVFIRKSIERLSPLVDVS